MREGRKPAQDISLDSDPLDIPCGATNNVENNTANDALNQTISAKIPGNRCKHNRHNPTFWSAPKHCNERSVVIGQLMDKLEKAYFDPRYALKNAQYRDGTQIRSELRHVILDSLRLMAYYMDDETQRIGRRLNNNNWDDVSLKKIAGRLDVSIDRVKDAFKHLVSCGYLLVKRQWRTNREGKKIGLPSIRQLTPKLFIDLGIKYERIFNLKKYREEKRLKKEMKVDQKAARVAQDFIKSCFNAAKQSAPRIEIPVKQERAQDTQPKTASTWLKNITASLKPTPS